MSKAVPTGSGNTFSPSSPAKQQNSDYLNQIYLSEIGTFSYKPMLKENKYQVKSSSLRKLIYRILGL